MRFVWCPNPSWRSDGIESPEQEDDVEDVEEEEDDDDNDERSRSVFSAPLARDRIVEGSKLTERMPDNGDDFIEKGMVRCEDFSWREKCRDLIDGEMEFVISESKPVCDRLSWPIVELVVAFRKISSRFLPLYCWRWFSFGKKGDDDSACEESTVVPRYTFPFHEIVLYIPGERRLLEEILVLEPLLGPLEGERNSCFLSKSNETDWCLSISWSQHEMMMTRINWLPQPYIARL